MLVSVHKLYLCTSARHPPLPVPPPPTTPFCSTVPPNAKRVCERSFSKQQRAPRPFHSTPLLLFSSLTPGPEPEWKRLRNKSNMGLASRKFSFPSALCLTGVGGQNTMHFVVKMKQTSSDFYYFLCKRTGRQHSNSRAELFPWWRATI